MIPYNHVCFDPLGDGHTLQVLLPEGGNWDREPDRDRCHRSISYTYKEFAPRDRIAGMVAF